MIDDDAICPVSPMVNRAIDPRTRRFNPDYVGALICMVRQNNKERGRRPLASKLAAQKPERRFPLVSREEPGYE